MQILAPPTDLHHATPADGSPTPAHSWCRMAPLLLVVLLALLGACDVSAQAQTLPAQPSPNDPPDIGLPSPQLPGMPAMDAGSGAPVLPDITLPDVDLPDTSPPGYDFDPQSPSLPGTPGAAATPASTPPEHSQESESSSESMETVPEERPTNPRPTSPSSAPVRGSGTSTPPSYMIQRRPKWT